MKKRTPVNLKPLPWDHYTTSEFGGQWKIASAAKGYENKPYMVRISGSHLSDDNVEISEDFPILLCSALPLIGTVGMLMSALELLGKQSPAAHMVLKEARRFLQKNQSQISGRKITLQDLATKHLGLNDL